MDIWNFYDITHRHHVICNPISREKLDILVELLRLPSGAAVLDIASGKGEFLVEMARAGAGHCIGIDPGVHPERIDDPPGADIEWIVDFYDERYTELLGTLNAN